ncbi:MAG: ParA family protein [Lachnospiraceae bacterium]|nr:ParA family protein [Lachnospiraceae bacterium]
MARKIAIMNEKGGVGKTATATTMAYLLAKKKFKTLLIDFDGQAHSTLINGMNPNNVETSMSTLINNLIEEKPLPESFILKNDNGVHFIPANSDLFTLERNLCNVDFRESKLAELVAHFEHKYDYVIIDCMPQMGTPMINALMCADEIIIPTQPHLLSVHGLRALINHIDSLKRMNHHLEIGGILITIDDKKTKLSAHVIEDINKVFGEKVRVFSSKIPRSIKVAEACIFQKTICEYLPGNRAAKAYEAFIDEYLGACCEGGE